MNNHELSENPESTPKKTEWDTLGEEVDFNDQSEKSEEDFEPVSFIYDNYDIESLFFNACYDSGDKNDPESYVVSLALADILPQEAQERLIKTYSKTGEMSEYFKFDIISGLSKKLKNANPDFLEEIKSDPFLRERHADYLAGRPRDDLNESDEMLSELFTRADVGFYESDEARNLLSDRGYLEQVYNGVLSYAAPSEVSKTAEEAREKALQNLPEYLNNMVNDGVTTVEELIKDPYLRKQRFDALSDFAGHELSESEWKMRELWSYDDGFFDSYEYDSLLQQKAADNPDIYRAENDDVNENIREAFDKLSESDYREILRAYERNIKKGDQLLFQKLLPILGLDKNPPKLEYVPSVEDKNERGFYQRGNHRIVLCEQAIREYVEPFENSDTKKSILDFLKRKKVGNEAYERMNVVAHEMWHAHQWAGEGIDDTKRKKYHQNFAYYMKGRRSYDSYREQLIEREAWAFGSAVQAQAIVVNQERERR